MASKSRWGNTADDNAREARIRREKEEKRKLRAAKARKAEELKAADAASKPQDGAEDQGQEYPDRPAKRRRLTPETDERRGAGHEEAAGAPAQLPSSSGDGGLLRFSAPALGPARTVGAYEKLNDIEEGTYGWVWRAREKATGQVVALKKLKVERPEAYGLPVTGLREMQLLRDCDHRNVLALREVVVGEGEGEWEGGSDEEGARGFRRRTRVESVFLVLDFVEHDLKTLLADMSQPFLPSEVKTLMQQLCSGVAYLHSRWILHRDLKTTNLLLSNRGVLKIADFGMARYVGSEFDAPASSADEKLTQLVVTLWYRSPELLLGAERYGRGVDMWSVGCIFAELATAATDSDGAGEPILQGRNEVDQLARIFELCGRPSERVWPGWRRLPNSRLLKLPHSSSSSSSSSDGPFPATSQVSARLSHTPLTTPGLALLTSLLSLDPSARPQAAAVLGHGYFSEKPLPKPESLFPTFPSRAGQERRRRAAATPDAPARRPGLGLGIGNAAGLFGTATGAGAAAAAAASAALDWSGIFRRQLDEARGHGSGSSSALKLA